MNETKNIFAFTRVSSQFYWCNTGPRGALSPAIYIKCRRLQVQIATPTDMEHCPQRDEKPFSRKGKIGKPSCSEYITAHCFGLLSTFQCRILLCFATFCGVFLGPILKASIIMETVPRYTRKRQKWVVTAHWSDAQVSTSPIGQ